MPAGYPRNPESSPEQPISGGAYLKAKASECTFYYRNLCQGQGHFGMYILLPESIRVRSIKNFMLKIIRSRGHVDLSFENRFSFICRRGHIHVLHTVIRVRLIGKRSQNILAPFFTGELP